jgi:hypothetical protein|tara:strand:- start:11002 stop:11613 length:612 start_codon:yes stop_codon:yes gene_type:complete
MKVVIIGGKESGIAPGIHNMNNWLHEYFAQYDLVQLSRVTGYDLDTKYDEIVEIARTADIFINSACVKDYQIKLLDDVYGHVPFLICLGSIAGDMYPAPQNYPNHPNYPEVKHKLKERCKWIQLEKQDATTNLLHLNVTETEDHKYNVKGLQQPQLFKILDFWFDNPYIANMDLKFWTESYVKEYKQKKIKGIIDYFNNQRNK